MALTIDFNISFSYNFLKRRFAFMFEQVNSQVKESYGSWIQVYDIKNFITVEFFPSAIGIIFPFNIKHCTMCIAVNQCYFKDSDFTKPPVDTFSDGLYHPNCHCQEKYIPTPNLNNIKLITPSGKETYTIAKKIGWIESFGYKKSQFDLFFKTLYNLTILSYIKGNYTIDDITNFGVKININVNLPGVNEKIGNFIILKLITWFIQMEN